MPEWCPLHQHSTYSLLDGLSRPKDIAKKCKEQGYKAAAISDHGNLSCVPQFVKALKKAGVKPLLGNEFYLCPQDAAIQIKENRPQSHLVVLAKNLDGWRGLIKATSESNKPEFFYYKPRLDLGRLWSFANGNWTIFSGHPGSDLADVCFVDARKAYGARTYEEAKGLVRGDWYKSVRNLAARYMDGFGRENFYFEIQLIDKINIPAAEIIAKILRHVGKKENIPCVATADSHYVNREDAADQRILLCSRFQTNLKEVERKIDADEGDGLLSFFRSNNYHIPSLTEMCELHKGYEQELENSVKIADECQEYTILRNPMVPQFQCPDGYDAGQYLRKLCNDGWQKKIVGKVPLLQMDEYVARRDMELRVLVEEAKLAPYFLIVQDYINWAKQDSLVVVRGSATGCLVSYLIGISDVDPIPAGLIFERFYNAGRNTPTHIAYPDIDGDFQTNKRESVIKYIKDKYGHDKVAQVATFGRLQGKAAIKDVLRAHGETDYETMNKITEYIPDEAKIANELQLMRDEGLEPSIIQWSLENNAKELKEWCFINDNGEYDGPYKRQFEQAKRLEGAKRNSGKHAAGLIVANEPLDSLFPLMYDKKTGQSIVGWEYVDAESCGGLKFDILGTNILDKLNSARRLLLTRKLH